jgi:Tol biopolymer transport system component
LNFIPGPEKAAILLVTQKPQKAAPTHPLISNPDLQFSICWLSDGRIVYSERGEPNQSEPIAWSQHVDPTIGQAKGAPKRLESRGNFLSIGATADSRKLMLLRADSTFQIFLTSRLGTNKWSPLRRFSLDQHSNKPWAWTPDSKAVIFTSDRNGRSEVYKQKPNQPTAELVVKSAGNIRIVRVMPNGADILYKETFSRIPSGPINLVRYPLSGGQPQTVVTEVGINNFQCARLPSKICIFDQPSGKTQTLFSYDSASGVRRKLTSLTDDPYGADWNLSPDGTQVAMMLPEGSIRFFKLSDGSSRSVAVHGWQGLHSIDWSFDSKTVIVAASSSNGASVVLSVDLKGNTRKLLTAPANLPIVWSLPSPNGQYQAVMGKAGQNDVWLVENF